MADFLTLIEVSRNFCSCVVLNDAKEYQCHKVVAAKFTIDEIWVIICHLTTILVYNVSLNKVSYVFSIFFKLVFIFLFNKVVLEVSFNYFTTSLNNYCLHHFFDVKFLNLSHHFALVHIFSFCRLCDCHFVDVVKNLEKVV